SNRQFYLPRTSGERVANPVIRTIAEMSLLPRRAHRLGLGLAVVAAVGTACGSSHGHAAAPSATPATSVSAVTSTSTVAAPPQQEPACPIEQPVAGQQGKGDTNPPGDIPDSQAFVPFTSPSGRYSLRIPEGWARSTNADTVSFTDRFNTITIQTAPSPNPPTVQTASSADVAALQSTTACFQLRQVSTVTR